MYKHVLLQKVQSKDKKRILKNLIKVFYSLYMCDSCGNKTQDVVMRALSYGGVRWALGSKPAEMIEKPIEKVVGIADEPAPTLFKAKSKHSNLLVKIALNAAVDIAYEKWMYDSDKAKGYKEMLGMCPCEYMKGVWELAAQILYEYMLHKKIKPASVIKDGASIYAQFPVRKLVLKYSGK